MPVWLSATSSGPRSRGRCPIPACRLKIRAPCPHGAIPQSARVRGQGMRGVVPPKGRGRHGPGPHGFQRSSQHSTEGLRISLPVGACVAAKSNFALGMRAVGSRSPQRDGKEGRRSRDSFSHLLRTGAERQDSRSEPVRGIAEAIVKSRSTRVFSAPRLFRCQVWDAPARSRGAVPSFMRTCVSVPRRAEAG